MQPPRIAFLVLAHQDPDQLERLCRRLQGHAIFVHVDARAKSFPQERIAALPGVTMLTKRTAVYWTDVSMVDATLDLLRLAGAEQAQFGRYVLLSGACYPVKPMVDFEAAMADTTKQWITTTPIHGGSHLQGLIARRWQIAPLVASPALDSKLRAAWNKVAKVLGRKLQQETGLQPYFGNSWWALTGACAKTILRYLDEHPKVLQAYRSVYAPDEQVFQTVLAQTPFRDQAIAIEDKGAETNQLTPLHAIGTGKDRVFEAADADFARAVATDKFFFRKVSSARSSALLDRVDVELLHVGMGG